MRIRPLRFAYEVVVFWLAFVWFGICGIVPLLLIAFDIKVRR